MGCKGKIKNNEKGIEFNDGKYHNDVEAEVKTLKH